MIKIILKNTRIFNTGRLPKGAAVVTLTKDENEVVTIDGKRILKVETGKKTLDQRRAVLLFRRIISLSKGGKITSLHILLEEFFKKVSNITEEGLVSMMAVNFEMANFEFTKYKSKKKTNEVKEIVIYSNNPRVLSTFVREGQIVACEVNNARVLSNTPGGEMTPTILARAAKNAARGTRVSARVLDRKDIRKLKMGGILGVSQGSKEEPKFIILEYKGGGKENPIVFVGKGVTFDTGGLNLKPSGGISNMYLDMSGGAAVIYALILCGKLRIKKNVVGIVPAVENMPSGSSYRPGDILKSMSGKTIEVTDTDAEGRIILADGLTYAKKYEPRLVVDVATLTGASLSALGQYASAIFTKNKKFQDILVKLGEKSGDYVWPLPLWEEYEKNIKGTFGDIVNSGKSSYGGAIDGAVFLYQFAKDFPLWVHIDIAPRMTATEDEYLAKGSVGAPVRLLLEIAKTY